MEDFPFIQGAMVSEVGMLKRAMDMPFSVCAPNGVGMSRSRRSWMRQCPGSVGMVTPARTTKAIQMNETDVLGELV